MRRLAVATASAVALLAPTSSGVRAPIVLLAALVALLALLAGIAAVVWWIGWRPAWVEAWRHAWSEAGSRVEDTWLEFNDWLRSGSE